jgi:hypothetical protein
VAGGGWGIGTVPERSRRRELGTGDWVPGAAKGFEFLCCGLCALCSWWIQEFLLIVIMNLIVLKMWILSVTVAYSGYNDVLTVFEK